MADLVIRTLQHAFVSTIPERLEPEILYVCIEFATAAHLCCCGCGREVFTPLSPTDWSMTFNGTSIALSPSIGNWSFPCRSHYWIRYGHVTPALAMSEAAITRGRTRDRRTKEAALKTHSADTPTQDRTPSAKRMTDSTDAAQGTRAWIPRVLWSIVRKLEG